MSVRDLNLQFSVSDDRPGLPRAGVRVPGDLVAGVDGRRPGHREAEDHHLQTQPAPLQTGLRTEVLASSSIRNLRPSSSNCLTIEPRQDED